MNRPQTDITLPSRVLVPLSLVALVLVVVYWAFSSGSTMMFGAILAAPFILLFVNFPGLWLITILGISRSSLVLPGLPSSLQLVHVLCFGFVVLIAARLIITKPAPIPFRWSERFLVLFLAVLALTAYVRGVGLRAMGSEMWGGMGYIKLTLAATFLLASRHIQLSVKQLRLAVFMMLGFSLLPALSQLLFLLSGGAIYQQFYFVDPGQGGFNPSLWYANVGESVERYQAAKSLGEMMLLGGLVLVPWRKDRLWLIAGIAMAALLVTSFTGFRTSVLTMLCAIFILLMLVSRQRLAVILILAVLGGAGLGVAWMTLDKMPAPIQRAFSFLPGAPIRPDIALDAQNSAMWRLEVWKLAWRDVPDYLWVGKGFAVPPDDLLSYSARFDSILYAYLAHSYHSGPLTLLLDLGLFGLLFGCGFLVCSAAEVIRDTRRGSSVPFIRRFHLALTSFYVASVLTYLFIFGDVRESFSAMFLSLALLRAITRTSAAEERLTPTPAAPRPIRPARSRVPRPLIAPGV